MKSFAHQKLDVANKTRSNIFNWHGQFTSECDERDLHDAIILR